MEKIYIATAQAFDDEMQEKIFIHRENRASDGWKPVEAPLDLAAALRQTTENQAVLVDCITLWLTNQMLSDADWAAALDDLCACLAEPRGPVILVSNEVGHGIVPETKLGRVFRDAQGKTNQRLAQLADEVIQVTVGLPRVLKGPGA